MGVLFLIKWEKLCNCPRAIKCWQKVFFESRKFNVQAKIGLRRVKVHALPLLMTEWKRQWEIFVITDRPSQPLKVRVFCLVPHTPIRHKRTVHSNVARVMYQKMHFGNKILVRKSDAKISKELAYHRFKHPYLMLRNRSTKNQSTNFKKICETLPFRVGDGDLTADHQRE